MAVSANIKNCSPQSNVFKAVCFNARSITNKFLSFYFEIIVQKKSPDFIAITETWLNNSYPDSSFPCHKDYSIFRKDRTTSIGGVLLFWSKITLAVDKSRVTFLIPLKQLLLKITVIMIFPSYYSTFINLMFQMYISSNPFVML